MFSVSKAIYLNYILKIELNWIAFRRILCARRLSCELFLCKAEWSSTLTVLICLQYASDRSHFWDLEYQTRCNRKNFRSLTWSLVQSFKKSSICKFVLRKSDERLVWLAVKFLTTTITINIIWNIIRLWSKIVNKIRMNLLVHLLTLSQG